MARNKPKPSAPHAGSPNPRRQAMEIISQALSPHGGAFAQDLLDERLARAPLKPEDKRLAADLTYGVIRRLETLDSILAAYADRPLPDMDTGVLQILRIGAYQALYQERVPAHAVVDEAVKLAKATGKLRAAGYVNGILRAMLRELQIVEAPDPARPRESFELAPGRACSFARPVLPPPDNRLAWLAAIHSFPPPLLGRWLKRYGEEQTVRLCAAANEIPPLFARPNLARETVESLAEKLRAEGVEAAPSRSGRTVRLPPHIQPAKLGCFRKGLMQIQDDASAAVAPYLDPRPGEKVLDLCAAPGGKSCHMAELMRNSGQIIAVDVSRKRLGLISENLLRMDHPIIASVESEGAGFAALHPGEFDRVLLDAPCSNTGVLRRRVEARWRFSESSLGELALKQQGLLAAALKAVKPGGALVYSTCSLEQEENSRVVQAAVRNAPGYEFEGEFLLLPEPGGADGQYMARIRRRTSEGAA